MMLHDATLYLCNWISTTGAPRRSVKVRTSLHIESLRVAPRNSVVCGCAGCEPDGVSRSLQRSGGTSPCRRYERGRRISPPRKPISHHRRSKRRHKPPLNPIQYRLGGCKSLSCQHRRRKGGQSTSYPSVSSSQSLSHQAKVLSLTLRA